MASTAEELFAAIGDGDVERVRRVLGEEPSLATARDAEGVSALMRARYRSDRGLAEAVRSRLDELDAFEAASFGDLDRLAGVLDADPAIVGAASGDGFTLLHLAAFFGQVDAVRLLLGRGAEVDRRATGWMTGTALHSAASAGHTDVVRILLEADADPSARQSGGFTPLHAAALGGNVEMARLLLARGADPTTVTDAGLTARSLADASADADTIALVRSALD